MIGGSVAFTVGRARAGTIDRPASPGSARLGQSDHGKWSHRDLLRPTVGRMSEHLPPEKPCPDCGGRGTVDWETPAGDEVTTQCSGCGGTGTVLA
ncbi:hypothetical protein SSP35_05_03100 [Streptomyces sp. NBRC 110611]|nr:hypothetical protein SSP35_05_03100 [Streptomyces sp. NBRC 110611]